MSLLYPDNPNRRERVLQLYSQCKHLNQSIISNIEKIKNITHNINHLLEEIPLEKDLHGYEIKDYLIMPNWLTEVMEINLYVGLLYGARIRDDLRKAIKELCELRLKMKFADLTAAYANQILIQVTEGIVVVKKQGEKAKWTPNRLAEAIKIGIKSVMEAEEKIVEKPTRRDALEDLKELDKQLNAWRKEDMEDKDYEILIEKLDEIDFQKSGKQKRTGWFKKNGNWYYFQRDGTAKGGLFRYRGKTYYLYSDGQMMTNNVIDKAEDNKTYIFGDDGGAKVGWYNHYGHWFYFDDDGGAKIGWYQYKGEWYYFTPEEDGNLYRSEMIHDTSRKIKTYAGPVKEFHFNSRGVCTNPY
ncbi:N-acetylmuramoyl-L-alanine amidase family protein [Bacillus cereus]|uniref:N-acetylmuramoyl-L-alanine amidase family protein n=1 Tax=Bacillus cereus TaxID=1396 RepID=UPI00330E03A6|nr:hypothetical protein [Bacillus cereus]